MDTLSLQNLVALGGVPIITALVQVIKGIVPWGRVYPLFAIIFGLMINLAIFWTLTGAGRVELVTAVFNGIISGLAASGLYSGVSASIKAGK